MVVAPAVQGIDAAAPGSARLGDPLTATIR
jgi:hypothetical protein